MVVEGICEPRGEFPWPMYDEMMMRTMRISNGCFQSDNLRKKSSQNPDSADDDRDQDDGLRLIDIHGELVVFRSRIYP